jgi:hypothetical protein
VALPTLPDPAALVTLGVDTHAETHVAVALDHAGRLLGTRAIPTTPAGYAALLASGRARWAAWTASAWKAPAATAPGWRAGCAPTPQVVVEVDRPDRAARRWLRLTEEITELDVELERLVAMAAPALVAVKGGGHRDGGGGAAGRGREQPRAAAQ